MTTNQLKEGLAYDDVLLAPQYSNLLPSETCLTTKLTRDLSLKVPLVAAAMDTVTEATTAITMAQSGGIGIIHKNLSIQQQADEVLKVKQSEAGIVANPTTVKPDDTVQDVLDVMKRVRFSGFPVVDGGKLVGIVTGRDIRFDRNYSRPVKEIMTKKVITAPQGTTPEEAVNILHKHRIEKLPVINPDTQALLGMYTVKDIRKAEQFPDASKDSRGRLIVGSAVSTSKDSMNRVAELLEAGSDVIVVDTAHGHSKGVIQTIKNIKETFSHKYDFQIVGGNIATAAATQDLIDAGVDAVKVGIGPGSICTTRIVAGIGVPQFTAVVDCTSVAKKYSIPVIADGGIKFSGDIVKALAAGAQTVMIGSLFAGTDEAPGELIIYQGKSYKQYRGMGSLGAMQQGSKDRYFQSDVDDQKKLVPEGIEGRISYKGPLFHTVHQLLGGIRAAMGYTGAKEISDLQQKAEFIRISSAALKESHVHDVYITREAPNYKLD